MPELSEHHDQCFVQQASKLQVLDQSAEGLVHTGHQMLFERNAVFLVRIPATLVFIIVTLDAGPVDLDQRDVGFDQSPCQQATLAKSSHSVAFTRLLIFPGQVECGSRAAGIEQIEGLLRFLAISLDGPILLELSGKRVELVQQ